LLFAHNLLDPNVPIHQQLYLLLRNEILDELWVQGQAFPGEQEVADRYGVSVVTSRKALDRLCAEGLVERGRGRRPRVTHTPPPARSAAPPAIFSQKLADRYAYEVMSVGIGPAPGEACRTFNLTPGSPLWQLKRLRRFEGRLHSVTHNAQSPERGARHDTTMLAQLAMGQILAGEGVKLGRLTRRIGVALAPVEVAGPLGISVHDSCLLHTMILSDTEGAPVEWLRIYLHPQETAPEEMFDLRSSRWETIAT